MSASGRWTLVLTATASFMVALDLLVVSTALPVMRADLDVSLELLQWAVTGYGLSFAALLMTGAALGDRYGRRRVFLVGTAVFTAASVICALAPNAAVLIAARVLQGAGAALVVPLAVALLMSATAATERGRILGWFEGLTGLATISGPVVGGALAGSLGWPWVFWVNVPIGLALLLLAPRRLSESHGPDTALDVAGMILVTGAAFGLVWALVRVNTVGWMSVETLGSLVVGTGLGIGFVVAERRSPSPMLPLELFRRRTFSGSIGATFGLFAALYGTVFFAAQFLQAGQGYTAGEAGIRLVPWTATLLLVAPIAGNLCDRVGARPVLAVGLLASTGGLAWLATVARPDTAYLELLPAFLLTGVGCSAAIPAAQAALIGSVDEADIGKVSGVNNTVQELAGAIGVAVAVAFFAARGGYETAQAVSDGFQAATVGGAALTGAGFVAALVIPRRAAQDISNREETHAERQ
jgi:EmrB/QacA subfamily drug resistance transporter